MSDRPCFDSRKKSYDYPQETITVSPRRIDAKPQSWMAPLSWFGGHAIPDVLVSAAMIEVARHLAKAKNLYSVQVRDLCSWVRVRGKESSEAVELAIRRHWMPGRVKLVARTGATFQNILDEDGLVVDQVPITDILIVANDSLFAWWESQETLIDTPADADPIGDVPPYLGLTLDDRTVHRHGYEPEVDFEKHSRAWRLVSFLVESGEQGVTRKELIERIWTKPVNESNLDIQKRNANDLLESVGVEIVSDNRGVWRIESLNPR